MQQNGMKHRKASLWRSIECSVITHSYPRTLPVVHFLLVEKFHVYSMSIITQRYFLGRKISIDLCTAQCYVSISSAKHAGAYCTCVDWRTRCIRETLLYREHQWWGRRIRETLWYQRTPVMGQMYQWNIVIPENADDETGARHISETLWYQRTSMIGQMYQWNVVKPESANDGTDVSVKRWHTREHPWWDGCNGVKPESASGGADLSMKRCNTREHQWWDRRISETWNQTVSVMGQMYQWNVVIPENTSDGTDVSVKRCDTREHQWWDRCISETLWFQRTPVMGQTYQWNVVMWYQRVSVIGQIYQWNVVIPKNVSDRPDTSDTGCNKWSVVTLSFTVIAQNVREKLDWPPWPIRPAIYYLVAFLWPSLSSVTIPTPPPTTTHGTSLTNHSSLPNQGRLMNSGPSANKPSRTPGDRRPAVPDPTINNHQLASSPHAEAEIAVISSLGQHLRIQYTKNYHLFVYRRFIIFSPLVNGPIQLTRTVINQMAPTISEDGHKPNGPHN